jgi:hypothetical protein
MFGRNSMKLLHLAVAATLVWLPPSASAQLYKCVSNGAVTYQSTPCMVDDKRKQPTVEELNAERRKTLAQEKAGAPGDDQKRRASMSAPMASADTPKAALAGKDAGQTVDKRTPAAGMVFKCDGRTHCTQMTSCAEATYFLAHCPGVKMDGNRDGVPCELQWCNR